MPSAICVTILEERRLAFQECPVECFFVSFRERISSFRHARIAEAIKYRLQRSLVRRTLIVVIISQMHMAVVSGLDILIVSTTCRHRRHGQPSLSCRNPWSHVEESYSCTARHCGSSSSAATVISWPPYCGTGRLMGVAKRSRYELSNRCAGALALSRC
jgi:hypothetical protein